MADPERIALFIDGANLYATAKSLGFDTYSRARKRIAYHGKLNGHVFQEPVISSWEKQCEAPFSL